MEYKASLDKLAKLITISIFIIFTVVTSNSLQSMIGSRGDLITIFIHSLLLFSFLTVILGSYSYAAQSYTVDSKEFTIVRSVNNIKIKLTDITEVRMLADKELDGAVRTLGIGGLFGYYGKYHTQAGNMIFYTTQVKNRILIVTCKGQKIVITPDDKSIIAKLQVSHT